MTCFTVPNTFIHGHYPLCIASGKGSKIVDVDGKRYVDWLCFYGPVVLGHADDKVDEAVIGRIRDSLPV